MLTLGLSSTEVAAVGLVVLAGGDAALIYASLSGTEAGEDLSPALAASAAFLALFAVPALAWARLVSDDQRPRGGVRCRTTRLRRRRHARHTGIRSSRRHVGGIYPC